MDNIKLAKDLLERLKMPTKQQGQLCCLTLLAMAKIKKDMSWRKATNDWIRIHDVIAFIAENYGVTYAENSRLEPPFSYKGTNETDITNNINNT